MNTDDQPLTDPVDLSLDELRSLRQELQHVDDHVSYARRVAQARIDLVKTEHERRNAGPDADVGAGLTSVLSQHLTGGPARPPRPTEDLSDNPYAAELDQVCAEHRFGRIEELNDAELAQLTEAIEAFEQQISVDRRARFERIDALSAELVRRYRDGEASVDSLLA